MLGLMMQAPLLLSSILMHAARFFPDVEIVSRTPDKPDHITTYSGLLRRSSQLANALDSIGIKPGDRVATLAWNSYRHLELYFGISGMRVVCHTINPRLFVEQIKYIINHAEDTVVFFDPTFIDLVHSLIPSTTVPPSLMHGPLGHRQPRAVDVPSENGGDLEHIDKESAAADRKLKICRGC